MCCYIVMFFILACQLSGSKFKKYKVLVVPIILMEIKSTFVEIRFLLDVLSVSVSLADGRNPYRSSLHLTT